MNKAIIISKDSEYIRKVEQRISAHRFKILGAPDYESAQGLLDRENCDIAIVDAETDELEKSILALLKTNYPNTIRLSVTEVQSNIEHYLPKKLNHTQIQCSKSISIDELFVLIEKVLEIEAKVKDKNLVNLMSTLRHLPTVPQVYFEMTNMIMGDASVDDIARKLEDDPAITSNILKLANTAFYNAKTGSIRQAIMYIGLINVKNIILTSAVFGNDGLDPRAREIHWEHVKITNKILGMFYQEILGKKLNNNISSVGLLHDIGSIVLMSNYPTEFDQIIKRVKADKTLKFHDLEAEMIGFSHEQLGGYLLDLWGLPFPIIEAALCHHDPMNPQIVNQELVKAVHIANHYAWKAMTYVKYDNYLNREVFESLGITETQFNHFFETKVKKFV